MGTLCEEVVRVCRALAPRVGLATADALDAVADRASSTPRLVLTGPVSAGKSTLVNALVGRRVAPTGAGECTRLVAHYVRGPVDRLDVVLTDGSRRPLPLAEGGRVPAAVGDRLGLDPSFVDHLVVSLTSEALDGLTVIDTPGTGSGRHPVPGEPRGATAGGAAAREGRRDPEDADAALVVLPAHTTGSDLADLADAAHHGPAGVVAVLGRADTVATGVPPVTAGTAGTAGTDADAVARRLTERWGRSVGPVSPVVGLLAETAATGALRGEDLHALRRLAGLDPATLDLALLGVERAPDVIEIGDATLQHLGALLDRRGVTIAVDLLRARPAAGLGEVCDALLAESGLARLVARVSEMRAESDVLAGLAAIRRLQDLARCGTGGAGGAGDAARVVDAVEELLARPELAEAALLDARARVRAGEVSLPPAAASEIERLSTVGPAARRLDLPDATRGELAGEAARRAAAWRSVASWGSAPTTAQVAYAVHRSYLRLWRELRT